MESTPYFDLLLYNKIATKPATNNTYNKIATTPTSNNTDSEVVHENIELCIV